MLNYFYSVLIFVELRTKLFKLGNPASSSEASIRGFQPSGPVKDIGRYFPFQNRERCLAYFLLLVINLYEVAINPTIKIDPEKFYYFIVVCGASGIGKTSFVLDAIHKISQWAKNSTRDSLKKYPLLHTQISKLDTKPKLKSMINNCPECKLVLRLSYATCTPRQTELDRPAFSLAIRVLYAFLNRSRQVDDRDPNVKEDSPFNLFCKEWEQYGRGSSLLI